MAEKEVCFVCDASELNGNLCNENISFSNNCNELYSSILDILSVSDLKSVIFLLHDSFGSNTPAIKCVSLMHGEEDKLRFRVKHTLGREIEWKLIELLGTIQNFKLMKKFNFCKHRFYRNQRDFNEIRPIWKLLYSVSKDLDDTELGQLNRIFFSGMKKASCCEELILELFISEKINESNLLALADALKCIGRPELSEKVIAYGKLPRDETDSPSYFIPTPTVEKPYGLAIIVNQEKFEQKNTIKFKDRKGSSYDRDKLQRLWQDFGFLVEVYNNLTAKEIRSLFEKTSQRRMDYFAFVACILSHGDKDIVYGSDSQGIKISGLVDLIANKCFYLDRRPKIFLIQACQGRKEQQGTPSAYVSDAVVCDVDTSMVSSSPEQCDVYLAVATIPGFVSYRSPESGSLFVTEFVDNFNKYGDKEDIEVVMKRVKNRVTKNPYCIQMPVSSSTLKSNLILKRIVH